MLRKYLEKIYKKLNELLVFIGTINEWNIKNKLILIFIYKY